MQMRVAIIGAGAVGKWLTVIHIQAGHEVLLICRNLQQAKAMENITIGGLGWKETLNYRILAKCWDECTPEDLSKTEIYLVTVKAYNWADMYQQWLTLKLIPSHSVWIAVHNGFVNYPSIAPAIALQICRSVLTYGLTATDLESVDVRGNGEWFIEKPLVQSNIEVLQNSWVQSLRPMLNVSITSEIESLFWRKLALNACLNPVTALTGLTNGEAWGNPFARKMIESLCEEAYEVLKRACNIAVDNLPAYIEQVCTATYANHSSMLQDVMAGRKTEVDALNGVLIEFAEQYSLEIKSHSAVHQLIKARTEH